MKKNSVVPEENLQSLRRFASFLLKIAVRCASLVALDQKWLQTSSVLTMSSNLMTNINYDLLVTSQKNIKQPKLTEENISIKVNGYHGKKEDVQSEKNDEATPRKVEIVWRNVIAFIILHGLAFYTYYLCLTFQLKLLTPVFVLLYGLFCGLGITAGNHRLWAHRSYKAKLPLRIFLMLGQSAALQNDIHEWARDHRVHHKFTDTDADPHNSKRGFFFSHIGWLMCKKHPDIFSKGKSVDMSDVLADPVVRFQMKYYIPLIFVMNMALPSFITWYFIGETIWIAMMSSVARYVISLNATWLVNSAAHMYGMRPYDKNISPVENKFVSVVAFGEGWHNYHHVFPWDYKTAELGNYSYNWTTAFLDMMAKIGLATDLKTPSEEIIRKRILRTGGKSLPDNDHHHHHHRDDQELIWGWGDKDMNQEEVIAVRRSNRKKA